MICSQCGGNRWRTKIKHIQWQCKRCRYIKSMKEIPQPLPEVYEKTIKLVSIIIPTHRGRDLTKVLEAIDKSTYRNVEIIIVSEGKERSTQRNIGRDKAKGEYLLFLDSDMHIAPDLIEDCLDKIQYCNGVYMREKIMTKGLFGRIRNWERQFYTGTAIDCVRFVRAKNCPRFDETMSGPEDSDWDRQIKKPKMVADTWYYHYEDVNFISYFRKKAYYVESMKRFAKKNPNDKILDFKWRCFGVFLENGKWKKFLGNPVMAVIVLGLIFIRGVIYLWKKY